MANKKISKMHQRVMDVNKTKTTMRDNTFWDDCNRHYDISTQAIHDVEGRLAMDLDIIVNTPQLCSKIKDEEALATNLTILRKDINSHIERLNAIRENHKDKSGGIKTPEEGVEVIQINGKYQEALEIYNANIMPTICHIFEQIAPAQQAMSDLMMAHSLEEKAKQNLLDPTVISDAVVKGE